MLADNDDHLQNRINFLQMLQILEAGRQDHVPANYPQLPATVLQALDYMDQHLAEDLRTEDIAQVCCISANTLLRHFQKSLASTPMEILRKKRLIASRDCLIRGDSVSEAAARCGFPDYSRYIQLFRRQFGVTPLQYKKLFHNA